MNARINPSPASSRSAGQMFAAAIAGSLVALLAPLASAGPLFGSGSHLPLPSTVNVPPIGEALVLSNIVHPTGFDGTWSSPASAGWIGTLSATGPVPNNQHTGKTVYDFTTLAAGELPSGTYFQFGDVDDGSATTEKIILTAFDSNGFQISSPWLDEPLHAWGAGSGSFGEPALADMPGWSFMGGQYTIDGGQVPGNPTVSIALLSNTAITTLQLNKLSEFNGFSLMAPVPTPGSMALLISAGLMGLRRKR